MTRVALGLLHALARVAVIASALELESGRTARASVWGAAAALLYFAIRVGATFVRARVEVDLSQRLVQRVLRGDLFAHPPRGKQDVVIGGLYDMARVRASIVPAIGADLAVVALVAGLAIARGEGMRLLTFLSGLGLGTLVVVAVRRSATRASIRAWEMRQALVRGVIDGLDGAPDIVASAASERHESRIVRAVHEARRGAWVVGAESLIIGRLPIIAGVALSLVGVYAITGAAAPTRAAEWATLAAMLAPFAGLAGAVATVVETRGPVSAVRELLEQPVFSQGNVMPGDVGTLVLEDVEVRYGDVTALRDASVCFARGLTVLSGNNGSGKSTILRLSSGLVPTSRGRLTIGGVSSADVAWNEVRRRASVLAQRPYYPVGATVRDFFSFLFDLDDVQCQAALARVDAWEILCERRPDDPLSVALDDLSGGQRQRVAIARALANEGAELYLLDEPDANLDRAGLERLTELLRELSTRATVIVAAHTAQLTAVAHHVVELEQGRVVRDREAHTRRSA